jgi:cell wall assembly regulator SMI1
MLADALRRLADLRLKDEEGHEQILKLQPPATEEEIRALAGRLPCPIPDDIRNALRVSKGLVNGPLESFSLVDLEGFGFEELLPHAYSIAHDGCGNYWVLDLLPTTTNWGPIYYACHDPAVLAYQSATIEAFLGDVIAMWRAGPRSPIDVVHEDVVHRIWRENPDTLTPADLERSTDTTLRAFAADLSSAAIVVDLRHAALGEGFSWGRFGPKTIVRRAGEERVWALMPPKRRPGLLARLFQKGDGTD